VGFLKGVAIALVIAAVGSAAVNAAELPVNEMPMYNYDAPKTEDMKVADYIFIAQMVEKEGSRENAALAAIEWGWSYYEKGDLASAMKRFNQAYLLDPSQGEAYTGMAVIVSDRDQNEEEVETLFRLAISSGKHTFVTYRNYGSFLFHNGRAEDARDLLAKGIAEWPEAFFVRMMYAGALEATGREPQAQTEMLRACEDAERMNTHIGRPEAPSMKGACEMVGISLP